jgi:hypothetical protein
MNRFLRDEFQQPDGFRRSLCGAVRFVATPATTMTPDQWKAHVHQVGQKADTVLANGELVAVVDSQSRGARVSVVDPNLLGRGW